MAVQERRAWRFVWQKTISFWIKTLGDWHKRVCQLLTKKMKFEADPNSGYWNGPLTVLFWDELLLIPKSPSREDFATRLIDGHRWANSYNIWDGVCLAMVSFRNQPYIGEVLGSMAFSPVLRMQIYTLQSVTLKQKFLIHGGAREKGLKVCLEKRQSQYE